MKIFKYLIIMIMASTIISCKEMPAKIQYVEKDIPVYVVPKAPTVDKPVLYLTQLTPAQENNIGELAKAFNISLTQETQYACQLQLIVDAYASLANNPTQLISPSFSISKNGLFTIIPGLLGKPPTLVVNTEKCNKP